MREKLVMGNWKMNGDLSSIHTLLEGVVSALNQTAAKLVVYPPSLYIPAVSAQLEGTALYWGAQNVYPADKGAFTGEIAGPMLKDFNCSYVLVGHSERRHVLGEDNAFVAKKFKHVKACGMIPVLCVGETLSEREAGETQAVLTQQLEAIYQLESLGYNHAVIAYEPVWAIGTGNTATLPQIQDAHAMIRGFVAQHEPEVALSISILYGGSVTPENAADIFSLEDVDGGLVGGASLEASRFIGIAKCINSF